MRGNLKGGSVKNKAVVWELNGKKVEADDVSHLDIVKVTQNSSAKADTKFSYNFPVHSSTVLEMDLA